MLNLPLPNHGRWLTLSMLIPALCWAALVPAADNMRFHGALVAEPCTIHPGDESIALDFGTIIDKYLYSYQRTLSKQFQIHLIDCDISQSNTATVMFSGKNSVNLPGLLAVNDNDMGIAIGLETLAGKPLLLNQLSEDIALNATNNVITLKAYVRGEPNAITLRTIKRGDFTAVATFSLQYY